MHVGNTLRLFLLTRASRGASGYTLGLLFAMIFMAALHVLGVKLIAPLSLRGMSEQERMDRLAKFNSTVLSRALLVLYIVYPGVSVAIFQVIVLQQQRQRGGA